MKPVPSFTYGRHSFLPECLNYIILIFNTLSRRMNNFTQIKRLYGRYSMYSRYLKRRSRYLDILRSIVIKTKTVYLLQQQKKTLHIHWNRRAIINRINYKYNFSVIMATKTTSNKTLSVNSGYSRGYLYILCIVHH